MERPCGKPPSFYLGLCYFSIFWSLWRHLGAILAPFWRLWARLCHDFGAFWLHVCTVMALCRRLNWALLSSTQFNSTQSIPGNAWAGGVTQSEWISSFWIQFSHLKMLKSNPSSPNLQIFKFQIPGFNSRNFKFQMATVISNVKLQLENSDFKLPILNSRYQFPNS